MFSIYSTIFLAYKNTSKAYKFVTLKVEYEVKLLLFNNSVDISMFFNIIESKSTANQHGSSKYLNRYIFEYFYRFIFKYMNNRKAITRF